MLTCINDVGWWEVERGRGKVGGGRGGSGLAGMRGLVGSVLAWPGESRDTQSPARKENTHAHTCTRTHTSGSEIAKEFEMFSGGRPANTPLSHFPG